MLLLLLRPETGKYDIENCLDLLENWKFTGSHYFPVIIRRALIVLNHTGCLDDVLHRGEVALVEVAAHDAEHALGGR